MNKYLLRIFTLVCLGDSLLFALPDSPSVVAGKVQFQHSEQQMHITSASDRSIINWKTFSSELGEVIKIDMPNSSSAVLNRVTSNIPSQIMGMISSNGHVYLINQNGILFGKNTYARVGALTASTLDLSDDLFLSGDEHTFLGHHCASLINKGQLFAQEGDVCLIGPHVVNEGSITCPRGTAALLAGKKIVASPEKHIVICLDPVDSNKIGLEQAGSIHARNVEMIADGHLYGLAIQHSGITHAVGFKEEGGRIHLYAQEGQVEVGASSRVIALSDDGSHEIQILGKNVAVKDNALIDVSAEQQAGKLFIGGGLNGKGLSTAKTAVVESSVRLLSDAKIAGDGGQVVVWSDEDTQFHGFASVRGGCLSGNGGFAEISGTRLDVQGVVDARAPQGKIGTVLFDPTDMEIGPGGNISISVSGLFSKTIRGTASTAHLSIATLNTNLLLANVLVTTASSASGNGDLSLNGDITINATVGTDLTFDVEGDFNLAHNIVFQGLLESSVFTINTVKDFNVTDDVVFDFEGQRIDFNIGRNVNIDGSFEFNDTTFGAGSDCTLTAGQAITFNQQTAIEGFSSFSAEAFGPININAPFSTTQTPSIELITSLPVGGPYETPPVITVSGEGNITTTAGQLLIDSSDDIVLGNFVINASSGDIMLVAAKNVYIGGHENPTILGVNTGTISITALEDVAVTGGYRSGAFAQIGSQGPGVIAQPSPQLLDVNADIQLSIGGSLIVAGGNVNEDAYALIGHGIPNADGGAIQGDIDILFTSLDTGSVLIIGGNKENAFAQIGHLNGSTTNGVTVSGDITNGLGGSVAIPNMLLCRGGFKSGAYALFGHGGKTSPSPDVFSGTMRAQAEDVVILAGTNNQPGTFAAFGFYVDGVEGSSGVSVTSPLVELSGSQNLEIHSQANANASVGARVVTSTLSFATLDVTQMNVATDWLAMRAGVNQINPNEVFLGVFGGSLASLTGENSSTNAISNLSVNVGESFSLEVSNIAEHTQVQGLITNGNIGSSTVNPQLLDFTVEGYALLLSGNNRVAIRSIDQLDFQCGTLQPNSDLMLFASSEGEAFIDCQNITAGSSITSGSDIVLQAVNASNPAYLQVSNVASANALQVIANQSIEVGSQSYIEHQGTGDLTLVVDNAFPTAPDSGPGAFIINANAHVGRLGGGSLRIFTADRAQNTAAGINNFNGQTFVPGPLFVNSQTERWGIYFPNAFIGSNNYAFFYKNN